jgi:hypothetical protein
VYPFQGVIDGTTRHRVDPGISVVRCNMMIQFSMSSQLWIHVEVTDELSQFIIAKSPSYLREKKYNYIQLYKFMQSV